MPIDYQSFAHPGIRSLVPYKPGKSIEELAREKGITDIIKLASNENPLGCSPLALKALRELPSQVFATYPSPINHPLMERLAGKLKINKEQLFLSNGSDYIYTLLMYCYALHSDRHILTHEYAFSTYEIQANTLQIPTRIAPVDEDWQVNIDNLIKACDQQTAIIFLANPNNPTGLLTSQNEIKYLLEHIPDTTLLVLDEAYYEFAASQITTNSTDWLQKHPNLVITRTFSKIYGMAGLRLGYAIASPEIVNMLRRVQLPFAVNQAALNAAHAAIGDDEFLQASLKINEEGMQQMQHGLAALNVTYLPSQCNFVTFDCKEDSMTLYNYLLDQGIIVRPLHPYKMSNHIRVSIGTKNQNSRFLEALKQYINK